jgi:hypothetical protein
MALPCKKVIHTKDVRVCFLKAATGQNKANPTNTGSDI